VYSRILLLIAFFAIAVVARADTILLGSIGGTITDLRNDAPVQGATLRIGSVQPYLGFYPAPSVPAVQTDSNGYYMFPAVPLGTWALSIEPPDPFLRKFWPNSPCAASANCIPDNDARVSVLAEQLTIADGWVATGGTIAGVVVRTSDGSAIPGMTVTAQSIEGFASKNSVTGPDGRFVISDLAVAEYEVRTHAVGGFIPEVFENVPCVPSCFAPSVISQRTPVMVLPDEERDGVDFSLATGAVVGGRISEVDATALKGSVGATLYKVDGTQPLHMGGVLATQASGYFTFIGLPAGQYTVSTYRSGGTITYANEVFDDLDCAADQCTQSESISGTRIVLAEEEQRTDVNFFLDPAASISGCVTTARDGTPVPEVSVLVYRVGTPPIDDGRVNKASTGEDGCYVVNHLPQTTSQAYRVRTVNRASLVDQVHSGVSCLGSNCDIYAGSTITLAHDEDVSGIDFSLEDGASLSGHVRAHADGPLVSGARILIFNEAGIEVRSADSPEFATREDGTFRTYALPDGTYYLGAIVQEGPWTGRYVLGIPQRQTQPLLPATSGTPLAIEDGASIEDAAFVLLPEDVFRDGFQ
jgi:hypothetical protein